MSTDSQLFYLGLAALCTATYVMFVIQLAIDRTIAGMPTLQGKAFATLAALVSIPLILALLPFADRLFGQTSISPALIVSGIILLLPTPFAFLLSPRLQAPTREILRTTSFAATSIILAIIAYRYWALR